MDDDRRLWGNGGQGVRGVSERECVKTMSETYTNLFLRHSAWLSGSYPDTRRFTSPPRNVSGARDLSFPMSEPHLYSPGQPTHQQPSRLYGAGIQERATADRRCGGRGPRRALSHLPKLIPTTEFSPLRSLRDAWDIEVSLRNRQPSFPRTEGNGAMLLPVTSYLTDLASPLLCVPNAKKTPAKYLCRRRVEVEWSSAGMQGRGIREIPKKTRQPATSFDTISTCENSWAASPGVKSGSPWWEVSSLTTTPLRLQDRTNV
ncbi:hypothetical protein PR048_026477 [Dryococelus australis]|uniref:Uncharacterized protein n=1 Tax=Dryococelus australis TaxID=614101 RepID=A0ABQ9GLF5_9NEOP|nr:hypothetical protein PR048_026477 [Dryococelus australis]